MIFMRQTTIFPMGDSPAVRFAARTLEAHGVTIVPALTEDVTHILLNVPTKYAEPMQIPKGITIIGGNLDSFPDAYSKVDLLREEQYLSENAALTADCALRLLGEHLPVTLRGCPILIIGWGRIGKCLASILKNLNSAVTVAARNPRDLGMLTALGYDAVATSQIDPTCYRAIINTVPAQVLDGADKSHCLQIDLASARGISGENVIWARGLPGKMLPESSGMCIAQAVLRHLKEG